MNRRAFLAGLGGAALTGCGPAEPVWAPQALVENRIYRSGGPAALTLYSMKNTRTGRGAHTSLLVDASQRVLFDPAGTFGHPTIPERNDVLFGMTPTVEEYYVSYHARITFFVVGHKVKVPAPVAERALRLVTGYGAVPKAHCTQSTSKILRQLPGFEAMPQTYFPNRLDDAFATLPGVTSRTYREEDPDNKELAALQIDMQIRSVQ